MVNFLKPFHYFEGKFFFQLNLQWEIFSCRKRFFAQLDTDIHFALWVNCAIKSFELKSKLTQKWWIFQYKIEIYFANLNWQITHSAVHAKNFYIADLNVWWVAEHPNNLSFFINYNSVKLKVRKKKTNCSSMMQISQWKREFMVKSFLCLYWFLSRLFYIQRKLRVQKFHEVMISKCQLCHFSMQFSEKSAIIATLQQRKV